MQVAVSHLRDAAPAFLAAGRVLLGYQPEPGRELSPGTECLSVANRGDQRGGGDEADAGDGLQPPARGIRAMPGQQLDLDLEDLLAQVLDQLRDQQQRLARPLGQQAKIALQHRHQIGDMGPALGYDDAVLGKMYSQGARLGGALDGTAILRMRVLISATLGQSEMT